MMHFGTMLPALAINFGTVLDAAKKTYKKTREIHQQQWVHSDIHCQY